MTSLHQENRCDSSPVCHTGLWKPYNVPILSKKSIKSWISYRACRTGPVVQRVNNAINWINRYPMDRYWHNKLQLVDCSLGSDLSGGQRCPPFEQFACFFDRPRPPCWPTVCSRAGRLHNCSLPLIIVHLVGQEYILFEEESLVHSFLKSSSSRTEKGKQHENR